MAIGTFDAIEVIRGAGAAGTVTVKSNGTAVDVTSYTGRIVCKEKKTDADGNAAINVALSVSDASNGVLSWSLTAAQTAALSPITYIAEFHIVPPNGEAIKGQGLLVAEREVWNGS